MTGPVVVGLDGSPESMTAAWWGAREARDRHLPVLLLHSWTTQPLDVPVAQEALSKQRYGARVLQRAEAELLHRYADLDLGTELVSAPAADALLERGKSAAMLVLGSRGHGSIAGFLLGSISLHVLGLVRCPAVTVRSGDPAVEEGWGRPAPDARGDVVVGVHEVGPAAERLLEFAFASAAARRGRVRAVHALPLSARVSLSLPAHGADGGYEEEERARLAEMLGPWREKFPEVPASAEVSEGAGAPVLLAASARGGLTVVGRRLHPSHLTWKLGPVTHAALHHAPCPVAVVPHD
ncbi:universal stress protein [Streptomyces sp. MS06]|uniref:universal stress protein n=1 Tax=Streptomyces sp. MS06 TaxID=3385974 RepID=UPI0039A0456F